MGCGVTLRCLILMTFIYATKENTVKRQNIAYIADPIGNVLPKPSGFPTRVGSPISLAQPDRYEFYTFDETGELIKRLMTLDEIQDIIATGDGDDGHLLTVAQADLTKPLTPINFQPPSHVKVHTIVNNVQNVLKAEMEAQKANPPRPTILDTPDVSSSWSMILPAIFGNTGGSITPDSLTSSHIEPETDVISEIIKPLKESSNDILKETTEHSIEKQSIKGSIEETESNESSENTQNVNIETDLITKSIYNQSTTLNSFPTTTPKTKVFTPITTTKTVYKTSNKPSIPITTETKDIYKTTPNSINKTPIPSSTTIRNVLKTTPSSTIPKVTIINTTVKNILKNTSNPTTNKVTTTANKTTNKPIKYTTLISSSESPSDRPSISNKNSTNLFINKINTTKEPYVNISKKNVTVNLTASKPSQQITKKPAVLQNKNTTIEKSTTIHPLTTVQHISSNIPIDTNKNITYDKIKPIINLPQKLSSFSTTTTPLISKFTTEKYVKTNITENVHKPVEELPSLNIDAIINQIANDLKNSDSSTSQLLQKPTVESFILSENNNELKSVGITTFIPDQDNYVTQKLTFTITPETTSKKDIKVTTVKPDITTPKKDELKQNIYITQNTKIVNESVDDNPNETSNFSPIIVEDDLTSSEELLDVTDYFDITTTDKYIDVTKSNIEQLSNSITDLISQIVDSNSTVIPTKYTNEILTDIINKQIVTETPLENKEDLTTLLTTTEELITEITTDENIIQTTTNQPIPIITNEKEMQNSKGTINKLINEIKFEPVIMTTYKEITPTTYRPSIKNNLLLTTIINNHSTTIKQNPITEKSTTIKDNLKEVTKNEITTEKNIQSTTKISNEIIDTKNKISKLPIVESETTTEIGVTEDIELLNMLDQVSQIFQISPKLESKSDENDDYHDINMSTTINTDIEIDNIDITTENKDTINYETTELSNSNETFNDNYIKVDLTKNPNLDESKNISIKNNTLEKNNATDSIKNTLTFTSPKYKPTTDRIISLNVNDVNSFDVKRNLTLNEKLIENINKENINNAKENNTSDVIKNNLLLSKTTSQNIIIDTKNNLNITKNITSTPQTKAADNVPSLNYTNNNTWKLVSTVISHNNNKSYNIVKTPIKNNEFSKPENSEIKKIQQTLDKIDLKSTSNKKGLESTTSSLGYDVYQFTQLCNELSLRYWNTVSTSGPNPKRSLVTAPFAVTSLLAMLFLGARGATSGEMNDILKLDEMVTFNPHIVFKNVTESIEVSKNSGVATSAIVRELYSDKSKGRLLSFYKDRVQQFYGGHVEEINFNVVGDIVRRRTNLLVKRQTWGKIPEYIKSNNMVMRPPLSVFGANIFQTDCTRASTDGRDGEMYFVVSPTIRQRRLVPVPAVLYKDGFLAGYVPELDATVAAIGGAEQIISTIFIMPGQQGNTAQGDHILDLQERIVSTAIKDNTWETILKSLIPRPGLELQIPRFSHRSVENASHALQKMGLKDLFANDKADLRGLNGIANDLYLNDMMLINTFTTCGEGLIGEQHHVEIYPGEPNKTQRRLWRTQRPVIQEILEPSTSDTWEEPRDYQRAFHDPLYDNKYLSMPLHLRPRQARLPENIQEQPRLKFDKPFMFFVRHNPTGLILYMGRYNPRLLP